MDTIRLPLKHMSGLDNLNQWIFSNIKPYVGGDLLEAGCGNGNLTSYYLKHAKSVVAIDLDKPLTDELKQRYPNVTTICDDLTKEVYELAHKKFDTIVCLNTLEHIDQEQEALQSFQKLLNENGRVIVQVPAFDFLYGTIDKAVGHHRRYTKKSLSAALEKAGFEVSLCRYFNIFGILGWYVNGKVLRRDYLSSSLLSIFDFMLPIFERVEKWLGPPVGLSVLCVANKKKF